MKLIQRMSGVVLAIVRVLLIGGGLLLSPKFTVSRSVVIAVPVDKVRALNASPRQWKGWSGWNRRDPAMQIRRPGANPLYRGIALFAHGMVGKDFGPDGWA